MLADSGIWLLCLYDTATLAPELLRGAMCTHPEIAGRHGAVPSADYVRPDLFEAGFGATPLPEPAVPRGRAGPDRPDGPDGGWVGSVPFNRERLGELRGFVEQRARRAGLTGEKVAELVLAANEVASNAVRHGGGKGRLRIWCEPATEPVTEPATEPVTQPAGEPADEMAGPAAAPAAALPARVLCEIEDAHGVLADPFVGYLPPHAASDHGWGLWITRQMCDLVEVRRGEPGVLVRLHMRLPD